MRRAEQGDAGVLGKKFASCCMQVVPPGRFLDGVSPTIDSQRVSSAAAQITVAQAGLKSAQTALSRAIIRSPITGIVLARSVEPGQTVNAGYQTPILFTLAKDLSQMQLKIDVDEADVGKVKDRLAATFVRARARGAPGRVPEPTKSTFGTLRWRSGCAPSRWSPRPAAAQSAGVTTCAISMLAPRSR